MSEVIDVFHWGILGTAGLCQPLAAGIFCSAGIEKF